jgi:DNA-damage-inducible protein J
MPKNAFIRARTDATLKQSVETIFEQIGLNTTEAINLFFYQVQLHQGLPFEVRIPNHETLQALNDLETGQDINCETLEGFKGSLGL